MIDCYVIKGGLHPVPSILGGKCWDVELEARSKSAQGQKHKSLPSTATCQQNSRPLRQVFGGSHPFAAAWFAALAVVCQGSS